MLKYKAGLLAFLVAAILSCGLGYMFFHAENRSLSTIVQCMAGTRPISCARPAVRELLASNTGAQIMDMLAPKLSPLGCHYAGHIVGEELYTMFHSMEPSIASCNYQCDAACFHGIVGEAFAEELGYTNPEEHPDIDLAHVPAKTLSERLNTVGKRLCTAAEACHGVGHIMYQAFKDLDKSYGLCARFALKEACMNGVAMEYSDALSRSIAAQLRASSTPDINLQNICTRGPADEKRACFRYFTKIAESVYGEEKVHDGRALQAAIAICKSYASSDDRSACFAGLATPWSYLILNDTKGAVEFCSSLGSRFAFASCAEGMVSVAAPQRTENIVAFCKAVPDKTLQSLCFQAFFHYMGGEGRSSTLCDGDKICLEAASRYSDDPWKNIEKIPF